MKSHQCVFTMHKFAATAWVLCSMLGISRLIADAVKVSDDSQQVFSHYI